MREFPASGRSQPPPLKPRGKVIPMPTPKVVRRRRSVRLAMISLGLLLAAAIVGRVYLASRPLSTEQVAGVSAEETLILELVNRERAKAGVAPLKLFGRLAVVARGHSYDMALRHYFSHLSPDGIAPEQRIRGSGIEYAEMGENIYEEDFPDRERMPERAIAAWMGSPSHRKNMLSPLFDETGVGIARAADGTTYITQDFIRK
ncbi:MAG TPA: CAP domain-containing protein [Candidatus Binataceae bacterium]|jgi:uncharacterized protein YkwD|nr:CAP domain-containing protein [Candidatus Binataceae bacterium]